MCGLLASCPQLSSGTKLPSKNDLMELLFHYKQVDEKSIRDAAHATADEVLAVWANAHIPTG